MWKTILHFLFGRSRRPMRLTRSLRILRNFREYPDIRRRMMENRGYY